MNKKLIGNTMWYFLGTAVSAVLGLISSPLLTRILSTETYAQYGLITSFTSLLATFIYMGQDESFMRFFERQTESFWSFFWRCIRIPLMLCAVITFILLEPMHRVLKWIFKVDIALISALLLSMLVFLTVVQRFLMLTARVEERALNYSMSNVVIKLFFLLTIVALWKTVSTLGINEILISLIVGIFLALLINICAVFKSNHISKCNEDYRIGSKELLSYGLPFALSSTLFWAVPMVEKMVIRDLTGWSTLAVYTSAAIFVTAMSLIKVTTNSIWVPYVYKNYMHENSFKNVFHKIGIALSSLCLCILGFVVITRRWLVLIFDAAYFDCRLIAPALVCGACFDLLTGIYSIGININKETLYHILIPVVQFVTSIAFLYLLLPRLGLIATGISYLLSIASSRIVQMIIGLHYYGTGHSYLKVTVMMALYIICGMLSCFNDSIEFDLICGIALIIVGCFVAGTEFSGYLKKKKLNI